MSLADLTSPTAVKMAMKRCDDMGRDAFLKRYGFDQAREYHLTYRGKTYDSKAIAGVAHGIQHPSRGSLKSSEYRGGAAKSAAGYRLFKLGFAVNKLVRSKNDWALEQCEKTAIAYFSCLKAKQSSKTFNRTATVRQVAEQIKQPIGAVDSNFQNIDAILSRAGLPRLNQVTAASAEGLLRLVVLDPLAIWWNDLDMPGSVANNQRAVEEVFIDVCRGGTSVNAVAPDSVELQAIRINFAGRDEHNRKIGRAGEEWVFKLQVDLLKAAGRSDLANQVRWISRDLGNGLGYHIESRDIDGKPLFIVVKTTKAGSQTPFYLTETELNVSKMHDSRYLLYRVFDLNDDPKIFVVPGPLSESLELTPIQWLAYPRSVKG